MDCCQPHGSAGRRTHQDERPSARASSHQGCWCQHCPTALFRWTVQVWVSWLQFIEQYFKKLNEKIVAKRTFPCSDKKLLAQAPGESTIAAEEEAARVVLRKIYGYAENRTPTDFCRPRPEQPLIQSVSS